ncbi:hypothetical protein [Fluviicola sp.]|uniref:hypothetical protein n=1 Tax=Fluviicola sp. TaxID=1917219 RepID=UPI0031D932FE
MKIQLAIQKIDWTLSRHYHFTDWEFGGGLDKTGLKAPRPEKTEWLTELFKYKLNRLKDFLSSNPTPQHLEDFILQEVININTTLFLRQEFALFVGKYNEIPYYLLNCNSVFNYYYQNIDTFIFEDGVI